MLTLVFLLLFGEAPDLRVTSGKATIYWTANAGKHIASCNGKDPKTKQPPCRRCFFDEQSHIAHRTIPLGTPGLLCSLRTGRCVRTHVRDRGPFGATLSCQKDPSKAKGLGLPRKVKNKRKRCLYWWHTQIRLQSGWKRRGSFDLTRPVARALGHQQFDTVVFVYPKRGTKVALR